LALVVDTGPLLAAGDPDDRDHPTCQNLLDAAREEIVVPAPVVVALEWTTTRTQPVSFVIRPAHTRSLRLLPDA